METPMPRPTTMVLVLAIACLGLASDSWSGADMNASRSYTVPAGGGESLRVLWTVSGYKRTDGATWSENEAKGMLFKPLDIDSTSITFDGKKCKNISFERKEVQAAEYLERTYHVTPQWLGIPGEVIKVVLTNCNIPGFAEYMHLKDRRLVIFLNGIFFFLEPNVDY
jgi:hypothetical protein